MTTAKAKTKTRKTGAKRASSGLRGKRKPVDLEALRQKISELVGSRAVNLVEIAIEEADKGHHMAMKYLFELIGLYPQTEQEFEAPVEDSLAKTLLLRLGLPSDGVQERAEAKNSGLQPGPGVGDAVK